MNVQLLLLVLVLWHDFIIILASDCTLQTLALYQLDMSLSGVAIDGGGGAGGGGGDSLIFQWRMESN